MEINKNSWHFKLVNEFFTPPTNLCPYVRKVLASMGLAVFFCCICVLLFGIVVGVPGIFLGSLVGYIVTGVIHADIVIFGVLQVIYLVYLHWLGMEAYGDYRDFWVSLKDKIFSRKPEKPKVHKEPSIFVEYVKAKHDKICPNLEFKG